MHRALLVLLTLAVLAAVPPADAQAPPGQVSLNAVAWHPYPDPEGDPFGFPANGSGGPDWMRLRYGAYYYPTVRIDGIIQEANSPDLDVVSYHATYRDHVVARLPPHAETPVSLVVNGSVAATRATVTVQAVTDVDLTEEPLMLRVALVEDDVTFAGANGVDHHRVVARAKLPDQAVQWFPSGDGRWAFSATYENVTVGTGHDDLPWRAGFLGAVVWLQNEGESTRFAPGEVVQSATHMFRDARPTVQVEKAVLLEMYTATWCDACVYGDGALELLLSEFGIPTTRGDGDGWRYFRLPSTGVAVAAVLLAAPAAWLVVRRWPA